MIPSVRPARGAPRKSAATQKASQSYSFPAPSEGWVSNHNLAFGKPGAAYRLDNFFPTPTGAQLRRGCVKHSEVGAPVRSLFTYVQANTSKLFAVTDDDIFLLDEGDDPASVHTITDGYISVAKYVNTDGLLYVRGVNGEDVPWVYDGTSVEVTPALTFPGGDSTAPEDLSFVWVFKDRFFFIKKGSLDAYYLPVAQIGGALVKFSLGGVFKSGGSLVYGGEWSQETGSGLSSMCVFLTDQGEVAVFEGSNPGDAASWARVGTYAIGKPLGPNAVIRRGGDLAIATDIGLISLSQALLRDAEALSPTAMSRPIESDWAFYAGERTDRRWSAAAWTEGQMLIVAPPTISGTSPVWLVAHATTGRWARFTGWDANCVAVMDGRLYFGAPDGNVYEANVTGADDGRPYVGVYVPLFDPLGAAGRKEPHMSRAVMRGKFAFAPRLTAQSDFVVSLPPPPAAQSAADISAWGVATWGDGAKWGDPTAQKQVISRWQTVFGGGEAISIAHQVTSGSTVPLDAEIVRTDVIFTSGDIQS